VNYNVIHLYLIPKTTNIPYKFRLVQTTVSFLFRLGDKQKTSMTGKRRRDLGLSSLSVVLLALFSSQLLIA